MSKPTIINMKVHNNNVFVSHIGNVPTLNCSVPPNLYQYIYIYNVFHINSSKFN